MTVDSGPEPSSLDILQIKSKAIEECLVDSQYYGGTVAGIMPNTQAWMDIYLLALKNSKQFFEGDTWSVLP